MLKNFSKILILSLSLTTSTLTYATDFVNFNNSKELAEKSILYVVRKQYPFEHHNTETMYQNGEICQNKFGKLSGNSYIAKASFDKEGDCVKQEILISAKKGVLRDVELSYDAKKIVFSMRKEKSDSFKIYELNLENKELKQLTFLKDVSDIDPVYLPNGQIVFASSRAQKYCACNRHIMANLYKMNSDGSNIRQIGNSIEYENTPSIMQDGRILYTRWEYVDRNFAGAQGLWTANPDGTRHSLYWGQSTNNPNLDGVQLQNGKVICIIGSCHDAPWGALALLDRNIDYEGEHSVVKIYPKEARAFIGKGMDAIVKNIKLKYEDPYPLDNENIFVSKKLTEKDNSVGLFMVNLTTDKESKIATHPTKDFGIYDFKIIRERKKDTVIGEQVDYSAKTAKVFVNNVYEGTHLQGIKKGEVKYLRIIEDYPKLSWSKGAWDAAGKQAPAMNYHDFDNKKVLGIVPVYEDGSAYFEIPSDKFIYLQALDKDKKMLQTMRSGLTAMPNETVSCTGCHESRMSTPLNTTNMGMAIRNKISKIEKTPTSGKLFSYIDKIQPILDYNCFDCHDYDDGGADEIILAGDRGLVFNNSYLQLHSKRAIKTLGAGSDKVIDANTWGAKHSKIINMIDEKHKDVQLSQEEYDTLVEWIDINAPYYATDDAQYANNPSGRCPLNEKELTELLTLANIKSISRGHKKVTNVILLGLYRFELVSFDRPEKSPILSKIKDKEKYNRALEIINIGAKRLEENPREDMPNYITDKASQQRKDKFNKLWDLELKNREAIKNNKKHFDIKKL